jgi:hypothetical protein
MGDFTNPLTDYSPSDGDDRALLGNGFTNNPASVGTTIAVPRPLPSVGLVSSTRTRRTRLDPVVDGDMGAGLPSKLLGPGVQQDGVMGPPRGKRSTSFECSNYSSPPGADGMKRSAGGAG